MKIDIICVGKIKESFYKEAITEFIKRLSKFCKIEILEVKDEKTPDNPSDKEKKIVLETEGERINKYISDNAFIIALCIEGSLISSEQLAEKIQNIENRGFNHIQFIIGGSMGISDSVKEKSHFRLSFSKMTFPHMLMRVILLEQVYRAFKISNNEPYHK